MQLILVIARVVLFGVFAVAGWAKLADRDGCREMLVGFGVPPALAKPLAVGLPVAELGIAIALLPVSSAWYAAMAGLVLLSLFSLGIAFNLVRGRTPKCNCFGQVHSAPIGWATAGRTTALVAVAAFLVWNGEHNVGSSVVGWLDALTFAQRAASVIGLGVLALLITEVVLLLQVLVQQGRLLTRLEVVEARLGGAVHHTATVPSRISAGLLIGSVAPSFSLNALDGGIVTLETLRSAGKAVLLIFTNPHCGPCGALAPEIQGWQHDLREVLTIGLVSEGTSQDNRAKMGHDLGRVLLQERREVADAYQAWGTPAAVLIRKDGSIGSAVAQGADAIRALVAQSLREVPALPPASHQSAPRIKHIGALDQHGSRKPVLKFGDPVPSLKLRDLSGKSIGIRDLRRGNVLLLFWNPRCGFCQKMLNDLRDWETAAGTDAPALVFVSAGTIEENQAMGLRSTVLLDEAQQFASAFGAYGTPMGVLIDVAGRVTSELVSGARAVMELANTSRIRETKSSSARVTAQVAPEASA
jgi:peroxiredoxin